MTLDSAALDRLLTKYGDARVARALHNSDENTARIDVARNECVAWSESLVARVREAESENEEQARLLGAGGSREAALQARVRELERERDEAQRMAREVTCVWCGLYRRRVPRALAKIGSNE